jgi:RNA polymerase sigma-70 factor, ECF subfamily
VVHRALMRLPVEQRAAVVAVDMQGYSVADTAALLGVAEGTVKSRCSRARVRLAELLGYLKAGPDLAPPMAVKQRVTDTGADG